MIYYIKSEFKRAFISRNNLIANLIVIFSLLVAYYDDSKILPPQIDAIDLFIRCRTSTPLSFLPLLAPLVACIPFANSYVLDKESGLLKYIYIKIKPKQFLLIRLIVNALVSGLVFVIAQSIMLIFLVIIYGVNSNPTCEVVGAFSSFYYSSKITYALIIIATSFIFGMVFSTLSLGISTLVNNKYLILLLPFIYVIITGTIFETIGLNNIINLNAVMLFHIGYEKYVTGINVLVYDGVLFLIGIILLYYGEIYKNEKAL